MEARTNPNSLPIATSAARTVSFWFNQAMRWDKLNHIMTGMFLGQIPNNLNSPDDIIAFISQINPGRNLGLVVSVVEPDELEGKGFVGVEMVKPEEWATRKISQCILEMRDFEAEVDLTASVNAVLSMREHIQAGEAVYVHCKAGRSRSAMICAIYIALFVDHPDSMQKYTLDEAIAFLKSARSQVSVGSEKAETALKVINEFNRADHHFAESHRLDMHLGTKDIKTQVHLLLAFTSLCAYRDEALKTHWVKVAGRAQHINEIISLIEKPHSEEWFFALLNECGPVKALLDSSPNYAKTDDAEIRRKLIDELKAEVSEMIRMELQLSEEQFKTAFLTTDMGVALRK